MSLSVRLPPLKGQLHARALRPEDQASQRGKRLSQYLRGRTVYTRRIMAGPGESASYKGARSGVGGAGRTGALPHLAVVHGEDHVPNADGTFALGRTPADYSLDVDTAVRLLLEEYAHASLHCEPPQGVKTLLQSWTGELGKCHNAPPSPPLIPRT